MGSKFETLQRDVFIVDHNLNTNALEDQSKRRIDLARGKSTRNFGFQQDFDKMSLERKFRFHITAYWLAQLNWTDVINI